MSLFSKHVKRAISYKKLSNLASIIKVIVMFAYLEEGGCRSNYILYIEHFYSNSEIAGILGMKS